MIDLEAKMSTILRADAKVAARVEDRCWLTVPAKPVFPAVMLRRIGGSGGQAHQGKRMFDQANVDIHAYGGSRAEALSLVQDCLDALCESQDITVRQLGIQRIPDSTMPQESGRDRERYIAMTQVTGH